MLLESHEGKIQPGIHRQVFTQFEKEVQIAAKSDFVIGISEGALGNSDLKVQSSRSNLLTTGLKGQPKG